MYELKRDYNAVSESRAEAALVLELVTDSSWYSTIPEEEEPMPAHTVGAGSDVSCSTGAWTRLDPTPQTGRTEVAVLNPDGASRLGILLTNSDSTPAAGTAPTYVIEADYGLTPGSLMYQDANVRHWGKSLGSSSVTAHVTQLGT